MIDYVLASGCSNTEGHDRQHEHGGPVLRGTDNVWPGQLAKLLGVPFVNLARCGAGNKHIHESILNYLNTENNGRRPLVCAMWSHPDRFEFDNDLVIKPLHSYKYRHSTGAGALVNKFVKKIFDFDDPEKAAKDPYLKFWNESDMKLFADVWYDKLYAPYHAVRRTTSYWINIQETCKARNFPFLQIQGLPLWEFPENSEDIARFQKAFALGIMSSHGPYRKRNSLDEPLHFDFMRFWPNEFTETLNKRNFLFWKDHDWASFNSMPNRHFVAFEAMSSCVLTRQGNWDRFQDHTRHPNIDGHRWIAEELYNRYCELYKK